MTNMKYNSKILLAGLCLVFFASCVSTLKVDTSSEPSFDGLLRIKGTSMDRVWVREGFDLTGYTKLMLQGSEIQYRKVRGRGTASARLRSSQTEFPLTEAQKNSLEEIFDEAFTKALTDLERYEIVKQPGPDVLLVRGTLVDVVSKAPPETIGRSSFYLTSVGEATLVVEYVDSQTDSVLIRTLDRGAAGTPGVPIESNTVTNRAEVRRMAERWARRLVRGLNEITTFEAAIDTSS